MERAPPTVMIAAGTGSFDVVNGLVGVATTAELVLVVPRDLLEPARARWPGVACEAEPDDGLDGRLSALARARGPDAVVVILSGIGTDGARGAAEAYEAGGAVLVQAPASAKFSARPRAAVATGRFDGVFAPADLAAAITERLDTLARRAAAPDDPPRLDLAALVRSERFLRTITDNLPATVSYWDRDIRCRFANGAFRTWFGVDPAAMIGRTMRESLGPTLYAQAEPHVAGALAGEPRRYERVAPKDGGRTCRLLATYLPHRADDEVVGFFAIVTDVTEQRAVEQELVELNRRLEERVAARTAERDALVTEITEARRLESLALLAGGIAHDFNNRLTGILGAATLLATHPEATPAAIDAAELVATTSRQAAELCRQLLAIAGRGRFVLDHGDLAEVVGRAADPLRASLPDGVSLRVELGRRPPPVAMDPDQIAQVVVNLVRNAIEAVEDGGGAVVVRTEPDDDGAVVTVTDTGPGIPEAELGRIFDPFYTTRRAGRGLGLTATQGIVRGHRGSIDVRSTPGAGTSVRVRLPAAPPGPAATPGPGPARWRGAGVVLVADDEPVVRQVAERALRRLGFAVELATDGQAAVEQFAAAPDRYVLVVLDLTMPRMTGTEALVEIRRLRPAARVLVMSGYTRDDPSATFVTQRPNAFLPKPFELEQLVLAIERGATLARLKDEVVRLRQV
ncbi:MAG: ATP-binding protein, partial [Myxococcota bacterium]